MAQSFVLAALAFMGHPPVLAIYAVAFVGGVTMAFDNPARRAFVVEMVPRTTCNNAVSLNSALMTSSRIIGPALAGLLVATVGFGWASRSTASRTSPCSSRLWMMHPAELRPAPVAERGKGQVRAGLRYVRRVPDLWVPLVMMAIVGTLAFNFQVVFPLFVTRRRSHGDDTTFTMLFSVVSIGSLDRRARDRAAHDASTMRHVVVAAAAFGVAMLALLGHRPEPGVRLPDRHAGGLREHRVPDRVDRDRADRRPTPEMRGRVLALQAIVFLGSTPIGGPIVGFVSQEWGRAGHRPRRLRLPVRRCVRHYRGSATAHLGATLGQVDDDAKNSTLQVATGHSIGNRVGRLHPRREPTPASTKFAAGVEVGEPSRLGRDPPGRGSVGGIGDDSLDRARHGCRRGNDAPAAARCRLPMPRPAARGGTGQRPAARIRTGCHARDNR